MKGKTAMYLKTITLNHQQIHLFDLQISRTQRRCRRAILDNELTDYFFDHDQISYIFHQAGHPAKLRLEPLMLQSITQPKSVSKIDYHLAISYALPLVAVMWSDQRVALDLCHISDFDGMSEQEISTFWELYFPNDRPTGLKHGTSSAETLAKHWSAYEAKLKALGLPLQQYSPLLVEKFSQLTLVSQVIEHGGKQFSLSMAAFITNLLAPYNQTPSAV